MKAIVLTINATWAIPAVLLIRLARPWVTVRVGSLITSRIGHFVGDTAIFLARRSLQPLHPRTVDLFWLPKQTSNEQWARMVRRQLYARRWVRYLAAFNKKIPGAARHTLDLPSWSGNYEAYSAVRLSGARFKFTPPEEKKAKAWLARRGWREDEKFVCLHVRDSAYLSAHPLHAHAPKGHYDYHDYRDSDIDAYADAVKWLADHGYWIVRMGKTVDKRVPVDHPRVIDYPFVHDRDDLLDIWLSVNCHLFISTATGISTIPWVYGGPPAVYVNALPLFGCASPTRNVWVPKHLRWRDSGKFLTMREHTLAKYGLTTEYDEAGITIEDLSAAEIAAAVREGEQRAAGKWIETEEDETRQRRAWAALRASPDFHKVHSYVHPDARFGSAWLKSMGDEFFE